MKVLSTRRVKLFWIVRIIVYYLKIIGLAPFSVGTPTPIMSSRRERVRTFQFSKFGLFYNFFLLSLTALSFLLAYDHLFDEAFHSKSFEFQVLIVVRLFFRYLSVGLVIMSWALGQRNAVRIMNGISEVEVQISGLRKQPSQRRSLISSTVDVIIITLTWINFLTTHVILVSYRSIDTPNTILSTTLTLLVPYWFILEYSFVVGRVFRDLETINKNLLSLKEYRNSSVSSSPFVNEFLQAFSSQIQGSQLAVLRSLTSIRVKLSELAQDIEDFFSFPILLCTAHSLTALVSDIHHSILLCDSSNADLPLIRVFHSVAYIFIHGYPFVSLAANVTRAKKQAKLTAQAVRKLLTEPLGPDIKAELDKFSLQLAHDDFTFTAYNFFTLDNTLIHSMLAATTTYIVILLQYKSSDMKKAQ